MANPSVFGGLRPVRFLSGAPYNAAGGLRGRAFDATFALAVGDPVEAAGDSDADGTPHFKRAVAAGPIDGVIAGFLATPGQKLNVHLRDGPRTIAATATASEGGLVLVATDPDLVFEIMEDAVGGALTSTASFLHADLALAAPDSVNGISKVQLDSSTAGADTTGTKAVKILALVTAPDNAFGANAKWEVTINKTAYRSFGSSR